jgi:phosphoribosyl 1,2-cyclic phosphodiesterase
MSLRICVLGSGSSGNCVYIKSAGSGILIDAGLSCKEIDRRLNMIGGSLNELDAVCVTHEHDDHTTSLGVLYRRLGLKVFANAGTIEALEQNKRLGELEWQVFTTGVSFDIGDIRLDPFSVPHDSYDPVGFVVSSGDSRVGVAMDLGMTTELVRERMKKCKALIVESNHDEEMLKQSPRPWFLKQRISGRQGHLSNSHAGQLLVDTAGSELRTVFLVHLSAECNTYEQAEKTMETMLNERGLNNVQIKMTYPDKPSEVVDV